MPAKRTAAYLVQMVRDHIQQPAGVQRPFRDGFAADALSDPQSTSILSLLNKAAAELLDTGYAKCNVILTLVPGQPEYGLSEIVHEITHVTVNGVALEPTSVLGLDRTRVGWQAYPGLTVVGQGGPAVALGRPQRYYSYSDVIGFDPAPDLAYAARILADVVPADMVLTTDYPSRIPARYHECLASRAAEWACNMDSENPAAASRIPLLQADWKRAVEGMEKIVNERQYDADEGLSVGEYRRYFRRGRS